MFRRGLVVGAAIFLAAFFGVGVSIAVGQTVLGKELTRLSGMVFCIPPFCLLVPTVSLMMAQDELRSSGHRAAFWMQSAFICAAGLLALDVADLFYPIYQQPFDVSNHMTLAATLCVGLLFGGSQWLWFSPRTPRKLLWLIGPVLGWFVPAFPLMMFPPGYRG
jgi:predicted transporter